MPDRDTTWGPSAVEVPQYEEYRSGSCLGTVAQWLGGIGLACMGGGWLMWPESPETWGTGWFWTAGVFLLLFLIPSLRAGLRSRANQEISRRNRTRYESYRNTLESGETEQN